MASLLVKQANGTNQRQTANIQLLNTTYMISEEIQGALPMCH